MAPLRKIERATGAITTTDATTTTVASFTVPDGASVYIEGKLVGRDTVSGDTAVSMQNHRAKRVSGTLSMVGSLISVTSFALGSDTALNTSLMVIDSSGNDVRLRVTGVAAKTIDWLGELEIWIS